MQTIIIPKYNLRMNYDLLIGKVAKIRDKGIFG